MSIEEKKKALMLARTSIERQYGKGSIMMLGERASLNELGAISTGSLTLDLALGVGGVPRGRIIEIFGPESSGKTTLAIHMIAETQKAGGQAVVIDAEHAFDPEYCRALGVNVEELLISQPDTGEQALDIAEQLIRSGAVDLVVIDSVAALVPKAELEGDMGDAHMGLQARLMSQALRKLTGVVHTTKSTLVFINQIREKIGVFFGNPETTVGGRALKFYSSVRIEVRKSEVLKSGTEIIGNKVVAKVVKNKVAPPFRKAVFDIIYGQGINRLGELIDIGVEIKVINKSGAWFTYGEHRLGQGRENARQFLSENPTLCAEIEAKIRENIFNYKISAAPEELVAD